MAAQTSDGLTADTTTGTTNQLAHACRALYVVNRAGSAVTLKVRVTWQGGGADNLAALPGHSSTEFAPLEDGEKQPFYGFGRNKINGLYVSAASSITCDYAVIAV